MKEYQTIKIWLTTHKRLRLLAALTGEKILNLIDRLVEEELKRVQK